MQDQSGLLPNRPYQPGMRVSQGVDADAREQVEITLAGRVIDIATLAAMQNKRIAGVILD
jgi:hypothetical protein